MKENTAFIAADVAECNFMKIKNIQLVFPICKDESLAKIYCVHEELGKPNWLREKFFIDKDGNTIAYFRCNNSLTIDPINNKLDTMFFVNVQVEKPGDKYTLANVISGIIVPTDITYENYEYGAEDGCIAVKKNKLWGFITEDGEEIIEPQYDDYCAFSSGLAAVCKNGVWGFINKRNEVMIPFEYKIPGYSCFNNGYAPVGKNNKWGFIDKSGEIIIPFKYEDAGCLLENSEVFPVKHNDKWGLIDINENMVLPFEYDMIECDGDYPYYTISKDGNCKQENKTYETFGLADYAGKIIIPCEYNLLRPNPHSLCVGIITEDKQEKYGLIDYNNNKITDFIYERMDDYSDEGLYKARLNGKWGFVDETGKVVVDFKYNEVEHFCGGYAKVQDENSSEMVINRSGQIVIGPLPYRSIFNIGARMFLVEKQKSEGYELIKL